MNNSNTEQGAPDLLAALLTTGPDRRQRAETILDQANGLAGLSHWSLDKLLTLPISQSEARRIKASFELGRYQRPQKGARIDAQAAWALLQYMGDLEQEEIHVIHLTHKGYLIREEMIYRGTATAIKVAIPDMFRSAIRAGTPKIIVAHNHPSDGDPTPSVEDLAVTDALIAAGKVVNVEVVDHLIIGHGCYTSIRNRGLCF